jgi:hypothetical protein
VAELMLDQRGHQERGCHRELAPPRCRAGVATAIRAIGSGRVARRRPGPTPRIPDSTLIPAPSHDAIPMPSCAHPVGGSACRGVSGHELCRGAALPGGCGGDRRLRRGCDPVHLQCQLSVATGREPHAP